MYIPHACMYARSREEKDEEEEKKEMNQRGNRFLGWARDPGP